jgi:plastocyanin
MFRAHILRTLLVLLALLLAAAIVLFIWFNVISVFHSEPAPTPSAALDTQALPPADAPAPTPQDYVTAQKGFQYLVSYTGSFLPNALTIKRGETIRFTNNSNSTLELSLAGKHALHRAEYFEYTFTKTGTFIFSNDSTEGTVTVK